MSQAAKKPTLQSVKASSSTTRATRPADLRWEVFVTPGIPIVTRDRPPGVIETFFQATASTAARTPFSWTP